MNSLGSGNAVVDADSNYNDNDHDDPVIDVCDGNLLMYFVAQMMMN